MKRDDPDIAQAFHHSTEQGGGLRWTFLSNHAHVLFCIARDPQVRVRDVAALVGLTERAVTRILTELEEGGVIERHRVGRRNHYEVNGKARLRHPLEAHANVEKLLELLHG